MSIELFRKGRQKVADLGKAIGNADEGKEWGEAVQGIPGYLYEHNLYIEIDGRGQGVLTIANTIIKDTSLSVLEEKLYDWAVAEGYEFNGTHAAHEDAAQDTPQVQNPALALASALEAIKHQLTVGEASEGDKRDIAWCAKTAGEALEAFRVQSSASQEVADSTSNSFVPTPMERMLAETLRAMVDSGGYYDDGDFYIEATAAERAGDAIEVVRNGFAAVRVYDEAMGRYGKDKLNPVIPDFSVKTYTYGDVLQRYRALLKDNPGKGLLHNDWLDVEGVPTEVIVFDPESETMLAGVHMDGPDVVDVRYLVDLAVHSTHTSYDGSEQVFEELDSPNLVSLPEGFAQSLREELAGRVSIATNDGTALVTPAQIKELSDAGRLPNASSEP